MQNFFNDEIEKIVFISEEQLKDSSVRKLYGHYYEDTFIFNVFPEALNERGEFLCEILPSGSMVSKEGFCAIQSDDSIKFFYEGEKLKVESYGLYQSIFSRNKGILETNTMSKKKVIILGCGSVGSLVAMELA